MATPTRPALNVLVADDHAPARRLVALALGRHASVLEVQSGAQAIELCRALTPALAILDLSMPGGLSGLDTCRALRQDPATAGMAVLICTASTRPEHAQACREAGADALLTKPFSPDALLSLVGSLVAGLGQAATAAQAGPTLDC